MRIVRIILFIVLIAAASALSVVGAVLVVTTVPNPASAGALAAAIATATFVYGPLILGSTAGFWDMRATAEARRIRRRWYLIVGGLDLVAAIVVVVVAVRSGAPSWMPVVIIAVGAVLLAIAEPLGDRFRRTEPPSSAEPWTPMDRDDLRRRIRTVVVTFLIAAVACAIGVTVLITLVPPRHGRVAGLALSACELPFIAAAMATIIVALPLNRMLRETTDRDVARLRRVAKVVLRRRDIPLDDSDQRAAARYATVIPIVLGFQTGYIALLYVGLGCLFVGQLIDHTGTVFPLVFLALYVILLAWLVPTTLMRARRARDYARTHAALLVPAD
jgi:MFS family permease